MCELFLAPLDQQFNSIFPLFIGDQMSDETKVEEKLENEKPLVQPVSEEDQRKIHGGGDVENTDTLGNFKIG